MINEKKNDYSSLVVDLLAIVRKYNNTDSFVSERVNAAVASIITLTEQADTVEKQLNHQGWISVSDGLPPSHKEVFIKINDNGKILTTTGVYIKGKVAVDSAECICDYEHFPLDCEDLFDTNGNDTGYFLYIPEGWWETKHVFTVDEYNHKIECEVTHWMDIPE